VRRAALPDVDLRSFSCCHWDARLEGGPRAEINTYIKRHGDSLWVSLFFLACLGSVVSLLRRLDEFEKTRGKSKEFLRWYGATLPIVGGIFAETKFLPQVRNELNIQRSAKLLGNIRVDGSIGCNTV